MTMRSSNPEIAPAQQGMSLLEVAHEVFMAPTRPVPESKLEKRLHLELDPEEFAMYLVDLLVRYRKTK